MLIIIIFQGLIDNKPEIFLENKFFKRNYYASEILKNITLLIRRKSFHLEIR